MDKLQESPASLYQYRSISGYKLGHLKRLLLDNELFLGSASRFNDPFDSKIDIDHSGATPQDWRRLVEKAVKLMEPGLSDSKLNARVTEIMSLKHYQDPACLRAIIADVQSNMYRVGVTCLSEIPDNILMWSHYAESHSGVCVEFDHTDENSVIAKALPVNYASTYARVKIFQDSQERQFELFLLTKADCWSHEREWRICHLRGGVGIQKIPANAIRSIRLGCRIAPPAKEVILFWARQRKLQVLQAKESSNRYVLEFDTIENV